MKANCQGGTGSNVVPLYGRDEMNLVEFPYGPITPGRTKTLEVNHAVWDRRTKKEVHRRLLITGSEAFGLPRPVDDQVLIGLKALTYESGFRDRKVFFSRHHLCKTLGWNPDGRVYRRIEESLDRIAGTTLKFKDAWWDQGEQEWRSHTFHLVDNVELCSHDRYQKIRSKTNRTAQSLSYFVWNEVIWKSFGDGFIKKIDMEMFRRIANGRKRDVAVRLYRVLDKKLYQRRSHAFEVERLAVGILGLNARFVSKMTPTLERASNVLVDCGYLEGFRIRTSNRGPREIVFLKKLARSEKRNRRAMPADSPKELENTTATSRLWMESYTDGELAIAEEEALATNFGNKLERNFTTRERNAGKPIGEAGLVRLGFLRQYVLQRDGRRSPTVA